METIRLEGLTKVYRPDQTKEGIFDIDLSLGDHGLYFIQGKSGCGKTTLLNVLGLIDSFQTGNYFLMGQNIKDLTAAQIDEMRARTIGFVFQDFRLFETMTVKENIDFGLNINSESQVDGQAILKQLGIDDLQDKKCTELSAGQKQRVAIARTLMKDPKIILADEPTGNLDSESTTMIMDVLKSISQQKLIIVVSHDQELPAIYGDGLIQMKDGHIISNDIKVQPNDEEVTSVVSKPKFKMKNLFSTCFAFLKQGLKIHLL